MLRRFISHLLLACALLTAQSAGLAHAATHLGKEPAKQEQNLLHLKLCDKCASFEKLSFGPPSYLNTSLCDVAPSAPLQADVRSVEHRCTAQYRSRAPPSFL
jgi:hypothetical protein